jgi:hypothetical protein
MALSQLISLRLLQTQDKVELIFFGSAARGDRAARAELLKKRIWLYHASAT